MCMACEACVKHTGVPSTWGEETSAAALCKLQPPPLWNLCGNLCVSAPALTWPDEKRPRPRPDRKGEFSMSISRYLLAAGAAAALTLAASANAGPVKHYHIFPATSFESLARLPVPPASDMN